MKTNKLNTIISAIVLGLCMLFAAPAIAQEEVEYKAGDAIYIKKSTTQYLTGQEPSRWVYLVEHNILQVGGKRFPEGILVKGIMSWVGKDDIILKNAEEGKAHQEELANEIDNLTEAEKKALQAYAKSIGATVVERDTAYEKQLREKEQALKAKEDSIAQAEALMKAQQDSIEAAARRMQAQQDSIAKALQAQQDSLAAEAERLKEEASKIVESLPVEVDTTEAARSLRMQPMHRFSIGARGGIASLMHQADELGKWKTGYAFLFDLEYAYYFGSRKKVNMGIQTGLSLGYVRSSVGGDVDSVKNVVTDEGPIDYTISADNVKEKDGQLNLEIPLRFAMITENGFFMNVGPKFIIPVYSSYRQTLTDPHITAYFPEMDVTLKDEVVTGVVSEEDLSKKGKPQRSKFNLVLSADLGYEWQLAGGNAIGLGLYADYSVFNLFKNNATQESLIDITAPSSTGNAVVDVDAATDSYVTNMGYFDFGVKFVYHFCFRKK